MEKTEVLYRMQMLMNDSDIEAFSAQKNAGSRSEYFARLTRFVETVPGQIEKLRSPREESEVEVYLQNISAIQTKLIEVGSSTLVLMAEKLAELAREKKVIPCANNTVIFKSKIRELCQRVKDARFVAGEEFAEKGNQNADTSPVIPKEARLVAAINSETVEKIGLLIENFEVDDALKELCVLMEFSYGEEIDQCLDVMHQHLTNFNYSEAGKRVQLVLQLIQPSEREIVQKSQKNILAIDDMPDVLSTVKSVLKNSYNVYGVTNHIAALKFLTKNTADLIILDIEMPDMNGFALLSVIRRMEAYKDTPVLFLTGCASTQNIKKSVEVGGNDFIKKPVDIKILTEKIGKYI